MFLVGVSSSNLSPFYPIRAKQIGLTVREIGWALGCLDGLTVFTSILFAKLMNSWGRRNTNAAAQLLFVLHYSTLVYLGYETDPTRFFCVSILA